MPPPRRMEEPEDFVPELPVEEFAPPPAPTRAYGRGLAAATIRTAASFTIEVPIFSTLQLPSDDNLFVTIRGVAKVHPRVTPAPLEEGATFRTYHVDWRPMQSGHYQVVIYHGSLQIAGSPFNVMAATPQPNPVKCEAAGEALTVATAHKTESFVVSYKDKLGTVTHATELDVFVEPVQSGSPRSRITRSRKIRVKVGGRPIRVRASAELGSEPIGVLMPGAVITVVEERIARGGNVEACIALDFMEKVDRNGKPVITPSKPTPRGGRAPTTEAKMLSFRSTPSPSERRAGAPSSAPASAPAAAPAPAAAASNSTLDSIPEDEDAESSPDASLKRGFTTPASRAGSLLRSLSPIPEVVAAAPAPAFAPASAAASSSSWLPQAKSERQQSRGAPGSSSGISNGAPGSSKSPFHGSAPPRPGAQHHLVQKRFGMKLSTDVASIQQQDAQVAGQTSQRQSSRRSSRQNTGRTSKRSSRKLDWSEQQAERTVGWATIVKDGTKLVTSKMRLNIEMRQQYQQQWARRVATVKSAESLQRSREDSASAGKNPRDAVDKTLMRSLSLELESAKAAANVAAFAYGGIYPGVLHAHGKLPESHRVFYSVGVAGQYLLHVRLRKQGSALPGSPFMLHVNPGEAHALSTKLPQEIFGEVGGRCSYTIATADQGGNLCVTGGGKLTCPCEQEDEMNDNDKKLYDESGSRLKATFTDLGNGKYTIVWNGERTGTFRIAVKIGGAHVVGSPARLKLISTIPDLSKCVSDLSSGSLRAVKSEKTGFRIRFQDVFGNAPMCGTNFRNSFKAGIALTNPGVKVPPSTGKADQDFKGTWVDEEVDENGFQMTWYSISFTPSTSGAYGLHAWVESHGGERNYVQGSPFECSVHANASDKVASSTSAVQEVIDVSGIAPGDYKISRDVFDEAQRRWGECSIDAFASVATTTLPRFWTEKPKSGSDGTNALKQEWCFGERVWAHPPLELLDALATIMELPERCAEVIVCVPYRPNTEWFHRFKKLSDDGKKYMAGKLSKVAEDAPHRVHEWPIMLFHLPGRKFKPPPAKIRAVETLSERIAKMRTSEKTADSAWRLPPEVPSRVAPKLQQVQAQAQAQAQGQVPQPPASKIPLGHAGEPPTPPPPPPHGDTRGAPDLVAELSKAVRERPQLRGQIQAIVARDDLDQRRKVAEIQRIVECAPASALAQAQEPVRAPSPAEEAKAKVPALPLKQPTRTQAKAGSDIQRIVENSPAPAPLLAAARAPSPTEEAKAKVLAISLKHRTRMKQNAQLMKPAGQQKLAGSSWASTAAGSSTAGSSTAPADDEEALLC